MIPTDDYRYERFPSLTSEDEAHWRLFANSSKALVSGREIRWCRTHSMEFLVETEVLVLDCPRCRFEALELEQAQAATAARQVITARRVQAETDGDRLDTLLRRDWKVIVIILCITLSLVFGVQMMRLDDRYSQEFDSWQVPEATRMEVNR